MVAPLIVAQVEFFNSHGQRFVPMILRFVILSDVVNDIDPVLYLFAGEQVKEV